VSISGRTKLFVIIGDPVAGVVSPPAINAWFKANGVDYPHKQSAYAQVDTMTARATRLGALNTVRREADGSLCGDATDAQTS